VAELRLDDPSVTAFRIQGRHVWVQTERYETVIRVPKVVRSTCWITKRRMVIRAGSVTVSGSRTALQPLWDTICDTPPPT
jgi:hypothetical protein